jgi:hypothetical protein
VAELVYAHDSKSCEATHVGSTPTTGTINPNPRIFLWPQVEI